ASFGGVIKTVLLTVSPPAPPAAVTLSGLTLNPASAVGPASSTATVTLTSAAPAGGTVVTLSSSSPAVASVPAAGSVTVAAAPPPLPVTGGGGAAPPPAHHPRNRRWCDQNGAAQRDSDRSPAGGRHGGHHACRIRRLGQDPECRSDQHQRQRHVDRLRHFHGHADRDAHQQRRWQVHRQAVLAGEPDQHHHEE